ncbi:UNVERIFIED_CONTAM: hypothetical protein H355_001470 [Colinus virginianus]|nr:hypothetical protein H355_001470 [Colinus virginianus]
MGNSDYKICVAVELNSKMLELRLALGNNGGRMTQKGDRTDQKIMKETIKQGAAFMSSKIFGVCRVTLQDIWWETDLLCAKNLIGWFMTDAARREQESLKKKIQPKLSLTLSSTVSRGNVSTPPRHSSGSLTPPVTPPITPSSSFRSSTPTALVALQVGDTTLVLTEDQTWSTLGQPLS